MFRRRAVCDGASVLAHSGCVGVGQPVDDLARASKSPYDLARYIDSHLKFPWEPMWKALGIDQSDQWNNFFLCESRDGCTTELITFLDPDQTILHLRNGFAWDTYLRYRGTPSTGWRFAGAYTAMFRYFEPRHESLRFGNKPFLRISTQGVNGSDVGSEIEHWFDLTEPDFKPVFTFSPKGWGLDHRGGPPTVVLNHRYSESASIDEDQPGGGIRLMIDVSFQATDDAGEYDLGSAYYIGEYRRDPGQPKFSLRRAYLLTKENAPISNQRFEALEGTVGISEEEAVVLPFGSAKKNRLRVQRHPKSAGSRNFWRCARTRRRSEHCRCCCANPDAAIALRKSA